MDKLDGVISIDKEALKIEDFNFKEFADYYLSRFKSKIEPVDNYFGTRSIDRGNGLTVEFGKNLDGYTYQKWFQDGQLSRIRSFQPGKNIETVEFDDKGTAYLKTISKYFGKDIPRQSIWELTPNTTITKGNFTAITDQLGRPILNKVTDLEINDAPRKDVSKFRDSSYQLNDQNGHSIAHSLGGTSGKENIVPQLDKINQGKMAQVENIVKKLKNDGASIDYEMKMNYAGTSKRPTSFEPKITVNGKEYRDLPNELKKIYNELDDALTKTKKIKINIGEKFGLAHHEGIKSGLIAAGLTTTLATVDNLSAFIDGEISVEEMVCDIAGSAVAAGALGYGSEFITTAVSQAMRSSSHTLISSVGKSCVPATIVSFAVESYDDIMEFANGKIDEAELTYKLGYNASGVAGGFAGGVASGVLLGGTVGSLPGAIIGGVVGTVLATGAYETAVDLGVKGAEVLKDSAEKLSKEVISKVETDLPDVVGDVKKAFTDFASSVKLPIDL